MTIKSYLTINKSNRSIMIYTLTFFHFYISITFININILTYKNEKLMIFLKIYLNLCNKKLMTLLIIGITKGLRIEKLTYRLKQNQMGLMI